jgi:hypothetical protein
MFRSSLEQRQSTRLLLCLHFTLLFFLYGPLAHAAPPQDEARAQLLEGLAEFDEAQRIQQEQPDVARRLFRSAAQRLHSVAASGVDNGRLQYDIGNAHLQAGDIGRAILHYRRAERLIPNDPLLKDNLSLARSKRLTAIAPDSDSELLRSALFVHYQTTVTQRLLAAVVFYFACWLLLMIWNVRPRRSLMVIAAVSMLLALTLSISVGVSGWQDRQQPAGVVLASDVPVYKGPGPSYQRLFEQPLQPGVEFQLLEQRGEWWNIELADGKTGWLSASVAELVPTPSSKTLEVSPS